MKNNPILQFLVVRALHRMTAKAMGVPYRPGRPALRAYADFTRAQALRTDAAAQDRMYRSARRMGSLIRRLCFVRTQEQARRILFWLYRNIGITLDGQCPGTVLVRSCYFSDFYTPELCRVMSAMDRGIFAGLLGGGELTFQTRITEGCSCCRAIFIQKQNEV